MSSLELQIPATASVGMFGLAEHYLLYPRSQSRLQALTDASLNLVFPPFYRDHSKSFEFDCMITQFQQESILILILI
jgi:hypothetical protein